MAYAFQKKKDFFIACRRHLVAFGFAAVCWQAENEGCS
jgi:hypothetical protein